jgi:type 2A phosphatase activator TIP41
MLGKENPIKEYGDVHLFEDELDDSGCTMSSIRFRTMADCFYILLRFYLRVDGVCVRIFDTRIFHDYTKNYILREFQYKESTYDELKAKGFKFDSEWSLAPNQHDLVFNYLELKSKHLEKVSF